MHKSFNSSTPLAHDGREPLLNLSHEMTRVFDTFMSGANSLMNLSTPPVFSSCVRLDVVESQDQMRVTADIPGTRAQDIEVRVEGKVLSISGDKQAPKEEQADHVHLMERSTGRFLRTVPLPFAPDPATVNADFWNGVLTISIPRPTTSGTSLCIEVSEREPEGPAPQTWLEPTPDGSRPTANQEAPAEEEKSN